MKEIKEKIEIFGAREHNLKNIDLEIPRYKLVVITGISGSGKSSLAFDTIYAEGQRRYMESFSAYARSFIGNMERPDVDKINGLSPVISIEQKTTSRNPRSTVGTTTEIYDFLRLLFARAGQAYSYVTGKRMVQFSEAQIINAVMKHYTDKRVVILASMVKGRKGHYRELFVQISKMGYTKVRVDGEIIDITPKMQLDRYKIHDIEVVIDRIIPTEKDKFRLTQSIQNALKIGKNTMTLLDDEQNTRFFSKNLMDPESGIAYDDPSPNNFSFNSAYGACQTCNGLGAIEDITIDNIIPDPNLSISRGGIAPLGEYRDIWIFKKLATILKHHELTLALPIKDLPKEVLDLLLYGSENDKKSKKISSLSFEGIIPFIKSFLTKETSIKVRDHYSAFVSRNTCTSCNGYRLQKEYLHFKIDKKNISDLAKKDISSLAIWFDGLEDRLNKKQNAIAKEILKEIRKRIGFLKDVGLDYLTLDRSVKTLSGGETQRIRLATQIGTQLTGVLYILDEPSIGLHQRDNQKLINALKDLRDLGNTILVVEHDKDMMIQSDYLIDIGPGAGRHGGEIVAKGTPKEFLKGESATARYLNGEEKIDIPVERRKGNGQQVVLKGCDGHNLKNVTLELPLGTMIAITGVSGSGKSTLIHHTLYPILNKYFFRAKREPLPYESIEGIEHIDKVIEINQSPIGRTPRSNPATYTGVFTYIRDLFTQLPESKIRGYKPGRFSFNVKGGRCEDCQGGGMKTVEMDFLPDVHLECPTCKGKRYNRETLEVRFKGKSISDVLDMTIEQAIEFFDNQPRILRKIKTIQEVGLGYITLGQQATTLSGGEAQRVKLATELSKKDTGKTFYILDEPTTGLHFQDIKKLIEFMARLVEKGNTVLIIEHNLDVIKVCDHIIDIGPEGGASGGSIVVQGTPDKVAKEASSYTGKFLKESFLK